MTVEDGDVNENSRTEAQAEDKNSRTGAQAEDENSRTGAQIEDFNSRSEAQTEDLNSRTGAQIEDFNSRNEAQIEDFNSRNEAQIEDLNSRTESIPPSVDIGLTNGKEEKCNEDIVLTDLKLSKTNSKVMEEYVEKEMTDVIGEYGPWQKSITFMCLLTCFPYVWQELNYGFAIMPLEHWCAPPEEISSMLNTTELMIKWRSTALPMEPDGSSWNKCLMYEHFSVNKTDWTKFLSDANGNESGMLETRSTPCRSWNFNHSLYGETIIERWNLVCRKSDQVYLGRLIYTVGFITSVLIFGSLGDRVGRRPVMLICISLLLIGSVFIAFSYSYVFYVVMRFTIAMGAGGLFSASFVMLMEVSGTTHRVLLGMMMAVLKSYAILILPGIAWLANDWVSLQLSITIPSFFLLAFWCCMPESPRWILSTGNLDRARREIEKAADRNNKSVAQIYVAGNALLRYFEKKYKMKLIMSDSPTLEVKSLIDVIKSPILKPNIIIIYLCWFIVSLTYNGLSSDANTISKDIFKNFAIIGAVQLPTLVITHFVVSRLGRRIPLSVTLMVACIMCLVIIPVSDDLETLRAVFTVIGISFITSSAAILYIFTSEIFPTIVRSSGIGTSCFCAGLGAIVAPFINDIGTYSLNGIPLAIFAAFSALGAVIVLRLPETKFKQIPGDLEEAEGLQNRSSKENGLQNTDL